MVSHPHAARHTCAVSGRALPESELISLTLLRPLVSRRILDDHPGIAPDAMISRAVAAEYRGRVVEDLLREERGEVTALEREVVASLIRQETVGRDVDVAFDEARTFGERVSDGLAELGGSWRFLIGFGVFLCFWMALNVYLGLRAGDAFDPYPFILLNLVLSCLAAVQAPVIMMSQRRQEARDRLRAQNDYRVNLKAELEIRHLHEKIDHLLNKQWERLTEIQRIQVELLEELASGRTRRP